MDKFKQGLELIFESFRDNREMRLSTFASDSMIVWNRNLSFLRDPFFRGLVDNKEASIKERGIIWRTYLLEYFADAASAVPGDFLEVGCYSGYTASVLTQRIDFSGLEKQYLLFDLFEWKEGDTHIELEAHALSDLFELVQKKFDNNPAVSVIRGRVPEILADTLPETIAFAHIDLNHAVAEASALELIYPRLSPGGVIMLDDYGWWRLSDQKIAVDAVLEGLAARIAELPTGQGLLIKKAT